MPEAELNCSQYLFLDPSYILIRNIDGLFLFSEKSKCFEVNALGTEVIKRCNGRFMVGEVIDDIERFCSIDGQDVRKETFTFLKNSISSGVLKTGNAPTCYEYVITGCPEAIVPIHFSIELTTSCNQSCIYCYQGSKSERSNHINVKRFRLLLQEAKATGLQSIELSGGEPSIHPEFLSIIEASLEFFKSITILSNGLILWKFVDFLKAHREGLRFQIPLNANNSCLHDSITGSYDSFNNTLRSIKELVKYNIPVNIIMNVYSDNLPFMEETLILARSLGARTFSCSPVVAIGSATTMRLLDEKQFHLFFAMLEKFQMSYDDIYVNLTEGMPRYDREIPHCGAGWKSITIDPNLNVRLCPFALMPEQLLGNIYHSTYLTFLQEVTPRLKKFKDTSVPNVLTCQHCEHRNFCIGCFVRPLYKIKDNIAHSEFSCQWNTKQNAYPL